MDIDKQIEAYLLSHKKQFSRLSKEGVARIAYLSGYLAAQQKHAPDVVESAASVSISPASEVSASEAESTPATTQVTQAVGRTRPERR